MSPAVLAGGVVLLHLAFVLFVAVGGVRGHLARVLVGGRLCACRLRTAVRQQKGRLGIQPRHFDRHAHRLVEQGRGAEVRARVDLVDSRDRLETQGGPPQILAVDLRLAQVVELRYFGGLSEVEIAELLKRSERSIRRDWQKARLYLLASLKSD